MMSGMGCLTLFLFRRDRFFSEAENVAGQNMATPPRSSNDLKVIAELKKLASLEMEVNDPRQMSQLM